MGCLAAFVADQEDTIMLTAGMAVGKEGIGTFNPHRQIVGHKQVKDTIDAVGRHTLAAFAGQVVRNIIGGNRAVMPCKLGKHSFAHASPLLARLGQRRAGSTEQIVAGMFVMGVIMSCHGQTYSHALRIAPLPVRVAQPRCGSAMIAKKFGLVVLRIKLLQSLHLRLVPIDNVSMAWIAGHEVLMVTFCLVESGVLLKLGYDRF